MSIYPTFIAYDVSSIVFKQLLKQGLLGFTNGVFIQWVLGGAQEFAFLMSSQVGQVAARDYPEGATGFEAGDTANKPEMVVVPALSMRVSR